jgi:ADP-heptose:LPS heptosyltransferase
MGESSILLFCWTNSLNISRDIFFYYHGLGDSLLFNTVVYELGRQSGKRYLVGTKHKAIYYGNPHAVILPISQYANYKIFRLMSPILCLKIHHVDYYHKGHPPREHILALLGDRVGLQKPLESPKIFLNTEEKARQILPKSEKPWVGIQSTGLSTWTDNKNWGVESFREVVSLLREKVSLVQFGQGSDPELPVDLNLQGKLSIREVFIALRQCRLFIGQEGFLMHAAKSVDTQSVIIYGGFLAPWQTGYKSNTNLYSALECAPCWLEAKCPFDKKCMTMIKPQAVAGMALKILST